MDPIGTTVAVLAVFIPIMAGILQYRQSIQQNLDKNFRGEVEKLTSKDREERLGASTNIGTFIIKGNRFYNEAVNILINRTSVELDYNVLGAMVASLRKVEDYKYKDIIQKLLDIERNFFIQRYPLKKWKDKADKELKRVQEELKNKEDAQNQNQKQTEYSKVLIENLKKEVNTKWDDFLAKERDFNELDMHSQAITDFISSFLGFASKDSSITGLEFKQNSLNNAVMENVSLVKSNIKASAFSSSSIRDVDFDGSTIINTVFTFSTFTQNKFRNCKLHSCLFDQANMYGLDFSNSEFLDVYFIGSDLTGANFKNVKGLKPIYFFLATNLDKAIFDKNFSAQLDKELYSITELDFENYVTRSSLTKQRRDALFLTLDEVKGRK